MNSAFEGKTKNQTSQYLFNNRFVSGCRFFSRAASLVIALSGIVVLADWMLSIPLLKSLHPSFAAMKANTPFNFLLIGISLWLLQAKESKLPGLAARRIAYLCAGIVAVIGFLTLVEYLTGRNLGIDQLLFKDPAVGGLGTPYLGRMAPNTAVNFLITGICLILLDTQTSKGQRPAQWGILLEGAISLLAAIGYIYGSKPFYNPVAAWTGMAAYTAVLFNFVFFAFLCSRPQAGFMALVSSQGLGGLTARYLLLPVIVILPLAGWIEMFGERAKLYDPATGAAVLTTVKIGMFVTLIWFVCELLGKVDRKRLQAEQDLLKVKDMEWNKTFNAISDLIFVLDKNHTLVQVNKAVTKALECRAEDILGRKCFEVVHKLGSPWPDCPLTLAQKDNETHSTIVDDPKIGVPFLVTVSPILNDQGEFVGAVHIAKNITEIKRKEELLQKAHEELEHKVEERTMELREKLEELERFRNATIDREFRMKELQDELERLKAEKDTK